MTHEYLPEDYWYSQRAYFEHLDEYRRKQATQFLASLSDRDKRRDPQIVSDRDLAKIWVGLFLEWVKAQEIMEASE